MGTWRTLHSRRISHAPLAYIAVFRQVGLEPGSSGPELDVLPIGAPRSLRFEETMPINVADRARILLINAPVCFENT